MNAFNLLVVIVAAVAFTAIQYLGASTYVLSMLCLTAGVMIIKKDNVNVTHVCGIVFATALLEYALVFIAPMKGGIPMVYWGTFIFGTQILICYIAIRVLVLRIYLSRKWLTKFNVNKVHEVHLTHAEGIIAGVYRVITIVMWLALAENILRNLAQLGIDKEIADMFYNWTFIYYNYELFIYPLRAIICGLVLSLLIVSSIDTERLEKNQTS